MRLASHRLPGLLLTEHQFEVPLDHAEPAGPGITVFAREVVAARRRDRELPWLLFLQGGPGQRAPRPLGRSGWLGQALADHRVLLLDARGTGRSTPATRQTLPRVGPPAAQARYLTHFRADSVVRDAELVRRALLGDEPWTVLGHSFGGFCALTYLSLAPAGLRQVLITGGLPPLDRGPADVYAATQERVATRTRRFLERHAEDGARLDAVADVLAPGRVRLPSGDPFPVQRLQQLGAMLGQGNGAQRLHYLLETAFVPDRCDQLTDEFLTAVERTTSHVDQPLYAVLQEAIYCQGEASRWAAQRVLDARPELSPEARPLHLTGEAVYPWMFTADRALAPLREAAELLAAHADWPALYDVAALAANRVPVAAAVYHDDMYVEHAFSVETARRVANLSAWVTHEFAHDGLHSDARVLERLFAMVRDQDPGGAARPDR
jgi:pimeloyl-ACP methyl ester carboxylesterase